MNEFGLCEIDECPNEGKWLLREGYKSYDEIFIADEIIVCDFHKENEGTKYKYFSWDKIIDLSDQENQMELFME